MTVPDDPIRFALQQAQAALRRGDLPDARHWAEQAVSLAPDQEAPWLMMAAVASPRASIAYLQRALEINPHSQRALQGLEWAKKRYESISQGHIPEHKEEQIPSPGKTQPLIIKAPYPGQSHIAQPILAKKTVQQRPATCR